jgi:hypothetical protein
VSPVEARETGPAHGSKTGARRHGQAPLAKKDPVPPASLFFTATRLPEQLRTRAKTAKTDFGSLCPGSNPGRVAWDSHGGREGSEPAVTRRSALVTATVFLLFQPQFKSNRLDGVVLRGVLEAIRSRVSLAVSYQSLTIESSGAFEGHQTEDHPRVFSLAGSLTSPGRRFLAG